MPYTITSAPDWVKKMPKHAQEIWVSTFNTAHKKYGETRAFKIAISAVKEQYHKVGDKWVKKASVDSNLGELTFFSAMHSLQEKDNLATFYLMNTTRNRLKWGVTDQALEQALPTIINKPIGAGPGYQIDKHYSNPLNTGFFTSSNKPNGYATVTAKITDPYVWSKLHAGEWGPISVVIDSYREVCSKCKQALKGSNRFTHPHIANGDAYTLVENFVFNRVDFCEVPAFPQAGLLNLSAGVEKKVPLELLASFYTSQSLSNFGRDAGFPEPTGAKTHQPKGKFEKMTELTLEEAQGQIDDLTTQVATLTTDKDTLTTKVASLETEKKKLVDDAVPLKAQVETIKGELKAIADERHAELITAAVEARWKAGLCTDKAEEAEALKDHNDATLRLLATDAEKVAAKLEAEKPTGPKLKHSATDVTEFDAAVNDMRAQLGFSPRELGGEK